MSGAHTRVANPNAPALALAGSCIGCTRCVTPAASCSWASASGPAVARRCVRPTERWRMRRVRAVCCVLGGGVRAVCCVLGGGVRAVCCGACVQACQALARAARGREFDLWIDTLKRLARTPSTGSRVLRRWLGSAGERLPCLVALHWHRQPSVVFSDCPAQHLRTIERHPREPNWCACANRRRVARTPALRVARTFALSVFGAMCNTHRPE